MYLGGEFSLSAFLILVWGNHSYNENLICYGSGAIAGVVRAYSRWLSSRGEVLERSLVLVWDYSRHSCDPFLLAIVTHNANFYTMPALH